MADLNPATSGPPPDAPEGFDEHSLPDWDRDFVNEEGIQAFARALLAPDALPPGDDPLVSPTSPCAGTPNGKSFLDLGFPRKSPSATRRGSTQSNMFITAQNDWAPIAATKVGRRRRKKTGKATKVRSRTADETREGYLYSLLKWPLLLIVGLWVAGLGLAYACTRLYIWGYEYFIAWRGTREVLRRKLRSAVTYAGWINAAKQLDTFLGNNAWKEQDEYAYYNSKTVKRVLGELRKARAKVEKAEMLNGHAGGESDGNKAVEELQALVEACVKNNFVGVENSRLYSETYYGTKNLVQDFVDEVEKGVALLAKCSHLRPEEKRSLFKRLHANYGRTALCLSGGASFAFYHFGVVKALLDADLLPDVITGTSGGALVAALVATRTNEELKQLLIPVLANKITLCSEPLTTWLPRVWRTGARFDSVDWARRGQWFTMGNMTFREAYERTGRILNVSCVPADSHSPTILTNFLTAPDCVIWSAVLASAAVPGIQNPVVLMMKKRDGTLAPYSFGHKWKDGSLRTDIPLTALNLHFNVNFSIVSQVNPHVNLFFFSSRGTVGEPVVHRKGRGWRGGFLGSATEQYIKLDLTKWLKVLRHLELLPRPMGQDWSQVWLQKFSGNITIWPRTRLMDFVRILSDPTPEHLSRMLHEGQQSCFPKLLFVANRMKVEKAIERGRRETRSFVRRGSIESVWSDEDFRHLLHDGTGTESVTATDEDSSGSDEEGVSTDTLDKELLISKGEVEMAEEAIEEVDN